MGVYLREAGEPPQGQGPLPPARGMCGPGRPSTPTRGSSSPGWSATATRTRRTPSSTTCAPASWARPQITTDGFGPYIDSVTGSFGRGVDFAQLVKVLNPNEPPSSAVRPVSGDPDPTLISTSKVERQNLTIRMSLRRYTRKTNAHSKSLHRHRLALALHFFWYNFCRPHMSLGTTPAVAAGLAEAPMGLNQLIGYADSERPAQAQVGNQPAARQAEGAHHRPRWACGGRGLGARAAAPEEASP